MSNQHPITPPPELLKQLAFSGGYSIAPPWLVDILTSAYQAGADQELEACLDQLRRWGFDGVENLRNARRPKPPSLAEEALRAHERSAFHYPGDRDTIRRALERLQELEGQQ